MDTNNTNHSILPEARRAGVSLHLSSLPGPYGIGELGDHALRFVDTLKATGMGVWQFLPTGPTAYGDSPYQPLSSFAGNENLIDLGDLVKRGLLSHDELEPLTALPHESVDYGALIPVKRELLKRATRRFQASADAASRADYDQFLDRHDATWLNDYAIFRILKSQHGERPWGEWSENYLKRDAAALDALESAESNEIESIKIMQFLFFDQWSRLRRYANDNGIMLFGDMPIYIALDSSDAWANRDILLIDDLGQPDAVAGVPPDYFSADGQLWGNPLYDWETHRENDFAWWIERVKATQELADIVRIDHFRGFESYWSIPADAKTAREGSWEPGAGDDLFHAMKRALGSLPIVAEDLGVITPEVEGLRDRHEIPGMRVLQFEVTDPDFSLSDVGENAVCYTGTHDNDTTLGWFRGSPGDIRSTETIAEAQTMALATTNGTPDTIHFDMIRAAFSTAARLAVAPMQDYLGLGSEARINVPGTSSNNWRWRVTDSQLSPEVCDNIGELISASGRSLNQN